MVLREKDVEIVGVSSAADLESIRNEANALRSIDGVIVTALKDSRSASLHAIKTFGEVCVHVLDLLFVKFSSL